MLTIAEAAKRACVCESIVRGWISSGQLPHYRLGAKGKRGKIVITVADLDGLLAIFRIAEREPAPKKAPARSSFKHIKLS